MYIKYTNFKVNVVILTTLSLLVLIPLSLRAIGQVDKQDEIKSYEYVPNEPLSGKYTKVKFHLKSLHATTVTDQPSDIGPIRRLLGGNDEVYAIVQWKDSFGKGQMTVPSEGKKGDADGNTAWNMETGKDKLINIECSSLNIKPGETAVFQVVFMERDGTPLGTIFSVVGNAASLYFLDQPLPSEIDKLIKTIKDGDDYLGAVRWVIVNDGILAGRSGGNNVCGPGVNTIVQKMDELQFDMKGSGARYQGTITNAIVP